MQYGYFHDKNKEYVITRPDTPRSWSNYLGSTEYGAIITNNAGGYSFFQSAAQGRFTRWRANTLPMDQPGRYLYIRDRESKEYWSASWQPVGKPLDKYKCVCRHGTAYTVIESAYDSIESETTYFVPLNRHFECWLLKLTNRDKKARKLSAFTFMEYANFWHFWQDWVNLQYTQYIMEMSISDNIINHAVNPLLPVVKNDKDAPQSKHTFFALTGAEIAGYDTDRDKFIGPYRGYQNPLIVEQGKCSNTIAVGDNGCGVLQADLDLAPGESKEMMVIMGIGQAEDEGKKAVEEFRDLSKARGEIDRLKKYWHNRLEGLTVETPDSEFNSMLNMWSPYNCLMTYAWSRAASLVYAGERDGLGYRDTVQDLLGVLHTIPEEAGERLELMITGQAATGGAMPVVKQFDHHPGREKSPEESEYRSDDSLWLFNTVPAYVKETGDLAFYCKVLPYADKGKDTVLDHLRRAIEFSLERSGNHHFPLGLSADWNDCLQLGQKGESIFVAFQLRYGLKTYIDICELLKKNSEVDWAQEQLKTLDNNLHKHAWDGQWFLRAFREDGFKFGASESNEGNIFLNPQTWAVYSQHLSNEQAENLMDVVHDRLATEYGLMICDPPFEKTDLEVVKATLFNKGMKENGAIFCHTQGWAVIAEAMIGHGDRAYQYFRSYMPAAFNTRADLREIEPYVYCQFINSKTSPRFGASRLPWLSGSATWSYYAATQYILGIRPEYDGIRIDPCVPSDWKQFTVNRRFRNRMLYITVQNPDRVNKGVKAIALNGEKIEGNFIQNDLLKESNSVEVMMG